MKIVNMFSVVWLFVFTGMVAVDSYNSNYRIKYLEKDVQDLQNSYLVHGKTIGEFDRKYDLEIGNLYIALNQYAARVNEKTEKTDNNIKDTNKILEEIHKNILNKIEKLEKK